MDLDRQHTDAQALRDFARRLAADNVDSGRLDAYLEELLENLIELPAVCRREAAFLSRSFRCLDTPHLCMLLHQAAEQLEHE